MSPKTCAKRQNSDSDAPRVFRALAHLATDHRITKCRKLRLRITQSQHGGGLPHRTARHPGSANGVAGARKGQGLAHILRARASLGLLASGPRSADFQGGGSGATLSQEQAEQKASCERMWATGPRNGHYLNGVACTRLPCPPSIQDKRVQGKKRPVAPGPGRQEGRKAGGRILRDDFQNPQGGRRGNDFCLLAGKDPPPAPHSFLMYPTPFLVPRPRTSPSILHAATTTKTGAEKPKDVPFVLRRDVTDREEDTGQRECGQGAEKRDSRRHLGWREQCISQLRNPPYPFPNIKHSN